MKKIIISLTALCVFGTSCQEDKFLNQVNPNTITSDTFWKSTVDYQSALTTVYGALQLPAIAGGDVLQNEEVMSDLGGTDSWYPGYPFRTLTFNDATPYVNDKWSQLYVGIFRANQVIEKIQNTDVVFTKAEKESIEAQARVLRAFFYFELVNSYGQAIIHTTLPKSTAELKKALSSKDEVTNTVIIPDLEFAKTKLPLTWDKANLGRVSQGTATTLLGKVYLYNKNWSKAAQYLKEVIDSKVYRLVTNPMDNFTDQNEFNSESIFEVVYNGKLSPGVNASVIDDTPFRTGAESNIITNTLTPLPLGGFNTLTPSYFLHELFITDEMDTSNPVNAGKTESPRMNASIFPRNSKSDYYQLANTSSAFFNPFISSYIKKFTNWYQFKNEDATNNKTSINFRLIRLADVYLMYAEAILNASGDGAVTEAISYIDMVRARAGVITLSKYMQNNGNQIPQLHKSKQVNGPALTYVPANKTNILTHIMRVERPEELCYEGHRKKDLVRWGIMKQVFTELRAEEVWRNTNKAKITPSVAPLYISGDNIRQDFLLAAQNYVAEKHDYFPIPTTEVQGNDQLFKK
jgi:starch-binding outer membrane protein, SusD/RagB family